MTHYFIDCGYSTATKNKPQHEVHAYLKSLHGKLILKDDLLKVQEIILDKIKEISEAHPRCKPIKIEFETRRHSEEKIWIKGFEAVSFKFEPATLVKPENIEQNDKV